MSLKPKIPFNRRYKPFPPSRIAEAYQRIDVRKLGGKSRLPCNADLLAAEREVVLGWDAPCLPFVRPWFACPRCKARCRFLYLPDLLCRKCAGLDYASRHLRRAPRI